VECLLLRRLGFKSGTNYVVVVEKVALGQIFLPVHLFSPVSIIFPIFHPYFLLFILLIEEKVGRMLENFKSSSAVLVIAGH